LRTNIPREAHICEDFSGSPPKGKDILPVRVCPKLARAQRTLAATEPDD
jgi:hypothetical protein